MSFDVSVNQTQVVEAEKNAQKLITTFKRVAEVAAVALGVHFAEAIAEQADQYTELSNKLKTVTQSNEEFEAAQRGVFRIARETYEPVNDVVDTYKRLRFATEELGLSQDDTLSFTKSLTQAIKLSGTDAVETQAAMRELTHGLTTNFEGSSRELRALQKNAPLLAKLVAESLGKTAKEFVELGKEGKITSDVFVQALLKAGPELDKLFKKRVPLFADLKTNLWNDWLGLLKQFAPVLDRIKVALGLVVDWVHQYVEEGNAMSSVIAALIVGVGALTVAFAPFILSLLEAVAPFYALYLLVQDFVTFLRGGKSVIGSAFDTLLGEGGADKIREKIDKIKEIFKTAFNDPKTVDWNSFWQNFYESARPWIAQVGTLLKESLKGALVVGLREMLGIKKDETAHGPDFGAPQRIAEEHPWIAAFGRATGMDKELRQKRIDAGINPDSGMPLSVDPHFTPMDGIQGPTTTVPTTPGPWAPIGAVPQIAPPPSVNIPESVYRRAAQDNGTAPQINNTITVQGNADANTAREIASQTGRATAAALGRDRSAIGASVGMSQ